MAKKLQLHGTFPTTPGPKGDPFTYEDFTPEQLEALKGKPGDPGPKGDPFTYEDFTPEQLEALKGAPGESGSGVYVGTDENNASLAELFIDLDDDETSSFVESPHTAEIGQTIVVKAVDENGKPTEWEAVDLPSGGTSGKDTLSLLLDWTAEETVLRPTLTFDAATEIVRILIKTPSDGEFTYNSIAPNDTLIDCGNGDLVSDKLFMHTLQKMTDNDEWLYSVTGSHHQGYWDDAAYKVFPLLVKITGGIKEVTLWNNVSVGVNVKIYGR